MIPRARAIALSLLTLLAIATLARPAHAGPARPISIVVQRAGDLRLLTYWVALGGGFFRAEGLDVKTVVAGDRPASVYLGEGNVVAAALAPDAYGAMLAGDRDVVVVAALLRNTPFNLVLKSDVAKARDLVSSAPLQDRVSRSSGLRIGVVDVPIERARTLLSPSFAEAPLVAVSASASDDPITRDDVDALWTTSPWLERALDDHDAKLAVHASAGEAGFDAKLDEALVVTRALAGRERDTTKSLVRALWQAQQLVHSDRAATVHAVLDALPTLDRRHVESIVLVYSPAIPEDPRVDADGVLKAAQRAGVTLDAAKVAPRVDGSIASELVGAPPKGLKIWRIAGALIGTMVGGIVVFIVLYVRKSRGDRAEDA
jgi:ABC-type nitrate/sulfonate/bicarbonate transport system substrate-binding protein